MLQKILAEKDRLIADGNIKRNKPVAEITDEETPFALPEGWNWVRNETLLSLRKGRNPKTLSDQPIGKPYLDIEALDRHQIRRYSDELQVVLCSANDILVVCDGSRSGLVLQGKDGIVGSTLAVIETPQFIQPYVKLIFRAGFQRFNSGMKGAAIPHLDTKTVLGEITGLPPLAEQFRIVTRVEELMGLCDSLEAKGKLEAKQCAQLVSILLGKLTASATPEELADNWQRFAKNFDQLLHCPESIDALEQALLQLAVRGLLVPQESSDEPANELIKKIRAEKDGMIARGQIKRDKPPPPIGDEEKPFELRPGWQWVQAYEVSAPSSLITYGILKPVWVKTGVPTVRVQDMKFGGLVTTALGQCSFDRAEKFEKTKLVAGDLLIAKDGATLGKTAFVPPELTGANITQHILRFPVNTAVDRNYIRLVIDSEHGQAWMLSETKGVALPGVNVGDFRRMPIPLPPLAEQFRIVGRVESLRRLCAQLRQCLANCQATQTRLAATLVESAAVGRAVSQRTVGRLTAP